jgi:hypothetical protein
MSLDVGDARSSHTQNLVERIRADRILDILGAQRQGEHSQRVAHVHLPQATPWFAAGQPANATGAGCPA